MKCTPQPFTSARSDASTVVYGLVPALHSSITGNRVKKRLPPGGEYKKIGWGQNLFITFFLIAPR
eukprot:11194489-Lingulodinium_polyedra.AAC.1